MEYPKKTLPTAQLLEEYRALLDRIDGLMTMEYRIRKYPMS